MHGHLCRNSVYYYWLFLPYKLFTMIFVIIFKYEDTTKFSYVSKMSKEEIDHLVVVLVSDECANMTCL